MSKGVEGRPELPCADRESAAAQTTEGHVGAAECEVGRWVYRRIEALMDAKPGTPEGAELSYLARVAESVEEWGEEACAGHELAPLPRPPAPPSDGALGRQDGIVRDRDPLVDELVEALNPFSAPPDFTISLSGSDVWLQFSTRSDAEGAYEALEKLPDALSKASRQGEGG